MKTLSAVEAMPQSALRIVIFCSVVDNFGDIGICWRLARQLVAEHQCAVHLFVDDLPSFSRICPELNTDQHQQSVAGVDILWWRKAIAPQTQLPLAVLASTDLCVEALACTIPDGFLQALAQANPAAVWLNLEYLTAEAWAAGCHGLPSPQPGIKLKKYFFFPGFTADMGGLLREQCCVEKARQLQQDANLRQLAWQRLGIAEPASGSRLISVFAYSQLHINSWFQLLAADSRANHVFIADGALAQHVRSMFPALNAQPSYQTGTLTLQILPFVAQPDYDLLLALCDVNFVRGEDSIIRAHWAGKPFIWQIYRQAEQAHLQKLQAFLRLMLSDAPAVLATRLTDLYLAWEQETDFAAVWPDFLKNYDEIQQHTRKWQDKLLGQQDLASNLVRFVQNRLIMSRNFS